MNKKTIEDIDPSGRKVLVRVDFNVPLEDGRVTDDLRIRASVPTLRLLLDRGAAVICMSHLGRPGGRIVPELSLHPVAEPLAARLGQGVTFVPSVVGDEARHAAKALERGQVLLLENVRFEEGEKKNDPALARRMASLADLYVNDAFGSAHRAHASTAAVAAEIKPAVAGLLMKRELTALSRLLDRPAKPYVALLGGAKISDKIELIETLMERVDVLLIGGAMAYTLLRARGVEVGRSRVEEERLDMASRLLEAAQDRNVRLVLPVDHVVASGLDADETSVTDGESIPADRIGADIGPRTIAAFTETLSSAGTVLWNGPLGVFEKPQFARGTREIAAAVRESDAYTVVGGGDSAAALRRFDMTDGFDHISTGGGASLEFLSGRRLPGVEALDDAGETP